MVHDIKVVDFKDKNGLNAIMYASFTNKQNIVDILLSHGANPDDIIHLTILGSTLSFIFDIFSIFTQYGKSAENMNN